MTDTETATTERHTREDVHTLAEAMVARMRWPSLHWTTQRLDYDAACALAIVALDHAPNLIASARVKQQAMNEAVRATEATA